MSVDFKDNLFQKTSKEMTAFQRCAVDVVNMDAFRIRFKKFKRLKLAFYMCFIAWSLSISENYHAT